MTAHSRNALASGLCGVAMGLVTACSGPPPSEPAPAQPPAAATPAPPPARPTAIPLAEGNAMANPYRMLEKWPNLEGIKPGAAIGIVPDGSGGLWLQHRSDPAMLHVDARGTITKRFEGVTVWHLPAGSPANPGGSVPDAARPAHATP